MSRLVLVLLSAAGCRSSTDPGGSPVDSPTDDTTGPPPTTPPVEDSGATPPTTPPPPTGPVWELPADRAIDWEASVGVRGGIPNRTVEHDCVAEFGAHADGRDTSAAIQRCLEGIGDEEVAYLPPGTYVVDDTIEIPSGRTLRGAGSDATVLSAEAQLSAIVSISGGYTDVSYDRGTPIVGGTVRGSDTIDLASARGIAPGDHLIVSEENDPSLPVTSEGTGGTCTWCGVYGSYGERARLQVVEVTAVDGDTVTIDPPMAFAFSDALDARIHVTPNYVTRAGVESLAIENVGNRLDAYRTNVVFQGSAESWLADVSLRRCGKRCVDLWFDNYRDEVRDSWLEGCVDPFNSDSCYGVQIEASSGTLVENNVFDTTSDGVITVSASVNVVAYNYAHAVHRTADMDQWFWPSEWTHGAHSSFDLWEGNELAAIEWDVYWGSNSHDVAFRNRLYGMDPTVDYDLPNLLEVGALLTGVNNHVMTAAGNVLGTEGFHDTYEIRNEDYWSERAIYATGTSGRDDDAFETTLRHRNHDMVTGSAHLCSDPGEPGCQGGSDLEDLPASLYRSTRPAFFSRCDAWPPIGPDVAGLVAVDHTPAWRRFTGAPEPECP